MATEISDPEGLVDTVEAAETDHLDYLQLQRDLCALAAVNKDFETAFASIEAIIKLDKQYNQKFARCATLKLMELLKAQENEDIEAHFKSVRQLLAAHAY